MTIKSKKTEILFVTGTDTNVGKTVLSLFLMKKYIRLGILPFYLKPFQTGCKSPNDAASDARFIYDNIPELKQKDAGDSVIYCLPQAKAPFFAAKSESIEININKIKEKISEKIYRHPVIIIEGAGGIMVPIKNNFNMTDLIIATASKPVVAARAGLGTINHTLMTLEILKNKNLGKPELYFIETEKNIKSEMIEENIAAVENYSKVIVKKLIKFQRELKI